MNVLALETSTETASLALSCAGELKSVSLLSPPAHSSLLLPALKKLLAEAQIGLSQLDVIACGVGPGAFTGVRLACSVAQGLALGAGLPVVPVGSLLALAQGQDGNKVYCAMDARMGEVYAAAYLREKNGGWHEVLAPYCMPPQSMRVVPELGWVAAGTAFKVYLNEMPELLTERFWVVKDAVPTAAAVLALAQNIPWIDPADLAPLYVRDRVAQTVAERLAGGGRA